MIGGCERGEERYRTAQRGKIEGKEIRGDNEEEEEKAAGRGAMVGHGGVHHNKEEASEISKYSSISLCSEGLCGSLERRYIV